MEIFICYGNQDILITSAFHTIFCAAGRTKINLFFTNAPLTSTPFLIKTKEDTSKIKRGSIDDRDVTSVSVRYVNRNIFTARDKACMQVATDIIVFRLKIS